MKRLNTLELLNNYIDSVVAEKGIAHQTKAEVMLINNIIEKRFYHSYCHYSADENFFAYLAGRYVWDHLSAIVVSEDILRYEYAACSQQAIVMMRVLKRRGYQVRKLGLVGHFVLEVYYNDKWHFYDPNKEPSMQGIEHDSLQQMVNDGTLAKAYAKSATPEEIKKIFSQMEIGETNVYPAKNARLFHTVTKFLSHYFMLVLVSCIGFFVLIGKKLKKKRNSGSEKHLKEVQNKVLA